MGGWKVSGSRDWKRAGAPMSRELLQETCADESLVPPPLEGGPIAR